MTSRSEIDELRSGLIELDRLERQSHELRGPRYGLGDGERASLRHAQLVGELTLTINALEAAHTEALDALVLCMDGTAHYQTAYAAATAVLAKAGRR